MRPTDKDGDGSDDAILDEHLRTHFAAQRSSIEAPDFGVLMQQAERVHAQQDAQQDAVSWPALLRNWFNGTNGIVRWGAGAAMTAALVVFVYYGTARVPDGIGSSAPLLAGLPDELNMTRQELANDINRTTRWQAPSDQWLAVRALPDVSGLPQLRDPRRIEFMNSDEEKNLWM